MGLLNQNEKRYYAVVHTVVRKVMNISARDYDEAVAIAQLDIERRYGEKIVRMWNDGVKMPIITEGVAEGKDGDIISEKVDRVTRDTRRMSLRLPTAKMVWERAEKEGQLVNKR